MPFITQGKADIKYLVIVVVCAVLAGIGIFLYRQEVDKKVIEMPAPSQGACTQEAKICPDGSAVGRTGPNCEFLACPDGGAKTDQPVSENYSCKENDKYFVVSKELASEGSADFLVKYKTDKSQIISCDYTTGKTDFEIKDQLATYFLALADNFLVLDSGTAPEPRVFTVYDLNNRKKVYSGSYSSPISVQDDSMTYWSPADEKATVENCPKINEYLENGLGAGIESHAILDLSSLTKKELGEYRCSPRQ